MPLKKEAMHPDTYVDAGEALLRRSQVHQQLLHGLQGSSQHPPALRQELNERRWRDIAKALKLVHHGHQKQQLIEARLAR
jgi:hypothetical protein